MSTVTNLKTASGRFTALSRIAFALVVSGTLWPSQGLGANAIDPDPRDPVLPGEPGPRASVDRSGTLQTRDGQTLHLTTDVGSVRIVALEPGAPPAVRYTVHIETDARAPLAESLLEHYSLTARATATGVEIIGASPAQTGRSGAGK